MERKKLIETTLPLEIINDASAYDKMPGIGPHPKGIHQWWAPLPLPCARAMLFATLVDDPSSSSQFSGQSEEAIRNERMRLFNIIRRLCAKDAAEHPEIFNEAYEEILKSCEGQLPTLLDPFCGGGSIPLEGQRLGLSVCASDLNPVAVLKTKATIEIAPLFSGRPPVNSKFVCERSDIEADWNGCNGMKDDIEYYGGWMGKELEKRVGHLFPKYISEDGKGFTVITWLWARTVRCPNPACLATVPLARSFRLSSKGHKNKWIHPTLDEKTKTVVFKMGDENAKPQNGTVVKKKGAICPFCNTPMSLDYIRGEGKAKRLGIQAMATVVEGKKGREYFPPDPLAEVSLLNAKPRWVPDYDLPINPRYSSPPFYGMTRYSDIFLSRQLAALDQLTELVGEAREIVLQDAIRAGMPDDGKRLEEGGNQASAYADAVATFLAFAIDRLADFNCGLSTWKPSGEQQMHLFSRQAYPMVWDLAESNIFANKGITWKNEVQLVAEALNAVHPNGVKPGFAYQRDAATIEWQRKDLLLSTDPPYYDNIGYADISDFFYVWLRRSLSSIYPNLFSTILTPKGQELVASPYRFGGNVDEASAHFETGFRKTFSALIPHIDIRFPITVYYAFKQAESDTDDDDDASTSPSTAWETMLDSLLKSGLQVTSTWPVRASQKWRMVSMGTNSLASYIVFSCRPKGVNAIMGTRREFISSLRKELPNALQYLQEGNIAPVDFSQAAIGPGISIFSRYQRIVESDGSPMTIRTALQLVNQELDAFLRKEEGELDRETQFILNWFEQYGMVGGSFGAAEILSKAKNASIDAMSKVGLVNSKGGNVSIVPRAEYSSNWDPITNARLTLWECTQHLIKEFQQGGEAAAAVLVSRLGPSKSDDAKNLAYRLFMICEKKGWVDEAMPYNELVTVWSEIQGKAVSISGSGPQRTLDV